MTKYFVTFLIVVAVLAGLMLYVGDDATLTMTSSAQSGFLAFPPIELTWQFIIALLTIGSIVMIGFWSLLLWLWRLPRRLKSGVSMRRRNRAIDAMEDALIAGAEGDMERSRKASARVRELAGSTDLGHIISATAAEACGDREEAAAHYTAMLESPKTRPTGQRGLAQAKLATGDIPGAVNAAQEAFSANPKTRWAFDTLFKALVADFRWAEARTVLESGRAARHIKGDAFKRRRAVLQAAEADEWLESGQHDRALELSRAALKDSPDFAPAAAIAAYELTRTGGQKKAASLLEESWQSAPHPALSVAYLDLYPGESTATRRKRVEKLAALAPEHRESKLLLIEHQLRAGDAVTAWSALTPMLQGDTPSARLCLLASEAESQLGNAKDARLWTERAATAPHELAWSDLDPEGPGFAYTPQDWRRLIFSYGDSGELVHPRAERQDAMRRPTPLPAALANDDPSDDEGVDSETSSSARPTKETPKIKAEPDLADRLDQLIDNPDMNSETVEKNA